MLASLVAGEDGGQLRFILRRNFNPRTVIGKQINPSPTHLAGDIRRIEREIPDLRADVPGTARAQLG